MFYLFTAQIYRAEKYIAEAIESVLAQDYRDWGLYLINDGSDEDDVAVAQVFHQRYSERIHLLEHPNGSHCGISASRNLGIKHAQGSLIAFLDADDTWYPHKLSSQITLLDTNPEADMVYGAALRWYSWNGEADFHVPARVDGFGSDCLVPGSALLATFLRDESLTPCPSSVLVRLSALERCRYFENQFQGLYDDQVLYAKLCAKSNIFVSSECVCRYRRHSESCCARAAAEGIEGAARERFLSWLKAYRENCENPRSLELLSQIR